MSILNKKLSEVTVEELLTHLGLDQDIAFERRLKEQERYDKVMESLAEFEEFLRNHSEAPESFTTVAELDAWCQRFSDVFVREPNSKLVILWAWVSPTPALPG